MERMNVTTLPEWTLPRKFFPFLADKDAYFWITIIPDDNFTSAGMRVEIRAEGEDLPEGYVHTDGLDRDRYDDHGKAPGDLLFTVRESEYDDGDVNRSGPEPKYSRRRTFRFLVEYSRVIGEIEEEFSPSEAEYPPSGAECPPNGAEYSLGEAEYSLGKAQYSLGEAQYSLGGEQEFQPRVQYSVLAFGRMRRGKLPLCTLPRKHLHHFTDKNESFGFFWPLRGSAELCCIAFLPCATSMRLPFCSCHPCWPADRHNRREAPRATSARTRRHAT